MGFDKDFDTLLNEILTDYRNQNPALDLSQGTLLFIKSACLASALWGAYQHQAYIARQIFPDTADSAGLEHHAWVHNLARKPGETDAALLERLLAVLRHAPAGGNRYDYVNWACAVTGVAKAWCLPEGQGPGTVDVLILADKTLTGSEIPSGYSGINGTASGVAAGKLIEASASFAPVRKGDLVRNTSTGAASVVMAVDSATQLSLAADIFTAAGQGYSLVSLCQQVREIIDLKRPVGPSIFRVLPPTTLTQDISLQALGTVNRAAIAAEITAWLNGFEPGQPLYRSQINSLVIAAGATDCVISSPTGNVTPTVYQMIRPGVINVA